MLYLLNRQLDWALTVRSTAPPPGVITSLRSAQWEGTYRRGPCSTVLTLFTKAIAMSTSAVQLRPFCSCSLALGCGIGQIAPLPRSSDDDTVQVFRFSCSGASASSSCLCASPPTAMLGR